MKEKSYPQSFTTPPLQPASDDRAARMRQLLHPPSSRELIRDRNIYDNRFNTNMNVQSTQVQFYTNQPDSTPLVEEVKKRNQRGTFRTSAIRGKLGRPPAPLPLYYSPINDPNQGPKDPYYRVSRFESNSPNSSLYRPADPDFYYENTNLPFPGPKRISETDLLSRLTSRNRRIYLNMDEQGRGLAIGFASEEDYDANSAVMEAARRMAIFKASEGEN